jgi:hypothetical protein
MAESSRIKRTLRASHVVKIWFWDGQREYQGEAVELSPEGATALLRMSQFGNATVIPTRKVVEGLVRHLEQRAVEFKCTSGILEVMVKATLTLVQQDFESPRRLLVEARFLAPSEANQKILRRLGEILKPGGPLGS